MARTASRSRTAFLSRTTKSKPTPTTSKPNPTRTKAAPAGTEPAATSGKPSRSRAAKKAKPAPRPARGDHRPLPFLLRLPAMLCAFAFMVAFAVVLARLTLQPSPASEALTHTNLHPGRSLKAYLDQPALRDAVKQIGGNLLLGVPFGILVPVVAPRARGVLRVLLLTAIVMLLVEFAQGALITGRAFDIDDVILNTGGALVGYLLLGRRLSRAVHARKRSE
ncbi:VanZ family protein [Streptomyces sp. NPDC002928]|uniref:VanZ family protein n=1 Tax=Streptomyces sp. NPDC002928 TaxID=3154440 RepID=UPI0033A2F3B5